MASSSSELLVAAFDFGTTYSGYAFSFRDNPLKVITNQNWVAGSEKLVSLKTPTCLLLTPDEKFHSFGFEAENKYASLAEDDEHHGWRFFRRFKMVLHNNTNLTKHLTVDDINGKPLQALKVFSLSIRYLRQHLLQALQNQTTGIEETDIKYVITVPAIWDDKAKQFMREAAIQAGLDTRRMKLALEPEAASIWCQIVTSEAQMALAGVGTQYMVIDLGGGTADISVHEKQAKGKLKEIHKASGGPWGGIYVDENYMRMLEKIFGRVAVEKLKKEEMGDYLDILREFETKKRNFNVSATDKVTFRVSSTLNEFSQSLTGRSLEENVAVSGYGNKVVVKGRDKLRVDPSLIKEWFDGPVDDLIQHIRSIFDETKMRSTTSILLVGGFGESSYVQERSRGEFPGKKLIIPNEAGLVVLKGAVRFGHDNSIVETRVMQYTYGIRGKAPFNEAVHQESLMTVDGNGKRKVNGAFIVFVRANESIPVGHQVTVGRDPGKNPLFTTFPVIRSLTPNPVLANEPGCEILGTLKVHHPKGTTKADKKMNVTLIFGDTELKIKVRIRKTGEEFYLTLNCLGEDTE